MKKILIITLISFISLNILGQQYELRYKGKLSSTDLGGYARDMSFYNDTCYILTGSGKILVTNSNGNLLTNYFSSLSLNLPTHIYADDRYLIILEKGQISFYTKKGQLIRKTSMSSGVLPWYLWVRNKSDVLVVTTEGISAYSYATGMYIKKTAPIGGFKSETFTSNGGKLYNMGNTLIEYDWINGSLASKTLTSTNYIQLYNKDYYLGCFINNISLWFEYYERDTLS